MSEDNNPLIGAYGDPRAQTPNLDKMAGEGILYQNAYSTAPVCAPSRFAILTGVNAESCAPAQHMRAEAHLPALLGTYPAYLRQAGYYCTNNGKTDYNCDVVPEDIWDAHGESAHWRDAPQGTPFMSVFNFMTTHESSLFGAEDYGVDPATIDLPAYLPDLPEIRQDYAKYYGLMQALDLQIGSRLQELEQAGLADDTIVFYYSDNGGVLPRSKRYCKDEGLRCALIVRVPENWRHVAPAPAGSQIAAPVTFVDLAPTVLSLAGLPIPATMEGRAFLGEAMQEPKPYAFGMRNRMDERYDMVRTVTDGRYRYIRNYMPHRPEGQVIGFEWLAEGYQAWHRAYLAGTLEPVQRRFFEPRKYEEFYDLQVDPDQVTNLADDPSQQARISAMRQALDEHMISVNDNGFIPEGGQHEGYLPSRVDGAYPLREIMALAERAARRDLSSIDMFIQALSHESDAMRYWAAAGLLIAGPAAASAGTAIAQAMRSDASEHVRIVAAEAAALHGFASEAVPILAGLVQHRQGTPIALQAINALTYIGPSANAVMPQIQQAAASNDTYLARAGKYLVEVLTGSFDPAESLVAPGKFG